MEHGNTFTSVILSVVFMQIIRRNFSSCTTENTLRLYYNNQCFNAAYISKRCLFWNSYEIHQYSVAKMKSLLMLMRVIHVAVTLF